MMGARLVSLALQPNWATLTPNARLVLLTMCQRSLDTRRDGHPPRTYWGGHASLAIALAGQETEASLRKVRRAITELVQAGAIEPITNAVGKSKACYLVTPENWPQQPPLDEKMGTCSPDSHSSPQQP